MALQIRLGETRLEIVHDVGDTTSHRRAIATWVFRILVSVLFAATIVLAVAERRLTSTALATWEAAAIAGGYFAIFLAVQAYQWTRRGTTPYPAVSAAAMGAVSAVMLAAGSYWHCSGNGTPVLTQIPWVGGLFFGDAAMPFGDVPGCPVQPPLSLELAQVMALGVIYFGVAGLVLKLMDDFVQRFQIRRARNLVLVVGAEDRVAYANALAYAGANSDVTTLTVSVGEELVGGQTVTPQAKALHLTGQISTPDFFQSLLHRRRETNLRDLHLIDPDTSTNLLRFDAIRDAIGKPPKHRVSRALLRIENPWAAEEWRRNAPDIDGWVVDAFSSYEATARELLRQVMVGRHDQLILCGGGLLALAVCEAVSRLERENAGIEEILAGHGKPASNENVLALTLVGPHSRNLHENHALHQRRFGNPLSEFDVIETQLTRESVERAAEEANRPAIIFSEPEESIPTEVAARHKQWLIFAFDADAKGIAEHPLIGQARTFGLALRYGDEPVSDWERTARAVHEVYRALWGGRGGHAGKPWPELDPSQREGNIRMVSNFIHTARRVGLAWGANDAHAPAGAGTLTDAQALELARVEHESWRAFMLQSGWKRGPRDERLKKHPSLVQWDELNEEDRAMAVSGVRALLVMFERLVVFGYVPYQVGGWWVPWRPYVRDGVAAAARQHESTYSGDDSEALAGETGTRFFAGPDTRQSTRQDERSSENTQHGPDDVGRKQEAVWARPAVSGEVIHSPEGSLVAVDGDWVIRDMGDNKWIVPALLFTANYRESTSEGS